jgi:hypothetical protein
MSVGNTKYGDGALQKNIKGSNNSAFGICSSRDTDISWNTSVGAYANMSNVSGISNVAVGTNANLLDVSGSYNTALGTATLLNNKANSNTAVGSNTMEKNTTGKENVAVGVQAGYKNTNGEKNVFLGSYAGFNNIDGSENVFLGNNAGKNSTTNYKNTFLGSNTTNTYGYKNSTVIGHDANMEIEGITIGNSDDNVLIPGTGYLTNLNPSNQIATEGYVQLYASTGIDLTNPCACATTDEIDLGTNTSTTAIDGIQINQFFDLSRVLVRCQDKPLNWLNNDSTLSVYNGIYVYHYNDINDASFTRASDCSLGLPVVGQATFIKGGNINKASLFKQISDPAIVGTASLEYIVLTTLQFSLGNGLELIGNQLNVNSDLTTQNGNPFLTDIEILGTLDASSIVVRNDTSLNGKLNVTGDASFNSIVDASSIIVRNNTSFNGKLNVNGDASFNSIVDVSGTLNVINSDAYINGIRVGRGNNNGNSNTIFGNNSGMKLNNYSSYNGRYNTFIGSNAGRDTNSGYFNVFLGNDAGIQNTSGAGNVYIGFQSGQNNSTSNNNTFIGVSAGNDTLSSNNTFIGSNCGQYCTNGTNNMFIGNFSGQGDIILKLTGSYNSCLGNYSGKSLKDGEKNIFIGYQSGKNNISGNSNSYIGYNSGFNAKGSNNILIGDNSDASGNINNSIAIGSEVKLDTSNTIILGTSTQKTNIPGKLNVSLDASFNSNVDIRGNLYMTGNNFIQLSPNKIIDTSSNINSLGGYVKLFNDISDISLTDNLYKIKEISLSSIGFISNATYLMNGQYYIRNKKGTEQTFNYASFLLSSIPITEMPQNYTKPKYSMMIVQKTVSSGSQDASIESFTFLVNGNDFLSENMYLYLQMKFPSSSDTWEAGLINTYITRLG